jgi:DNA-binding transcriptional MerR regulator
MPDTEQGTYRIGAVSRITGIPADTLRVWERRYHVVEPNRTDGKFRRYSRDDVARLALIKQLVDAGNAISSVANLPVTELQERLATHAASNAVIPQALRETRMRVVVIGDTLPARIVYGGEAIEGLEFVASFPTQDEFETAANRPAADAVVVELATLDVQTASKVNSLLQMSGIRRAIVVYGFGRRDSVARLSRGQVIALRAPVNLTELRLACLGSMAAPPETLPRSILGLAPPRRFKTAELTRLASVSTTIQCECPRHLVDLVLSLSAFETYSAECENRSREDAALHAHLNAVTAQARDLLEQALEHVVDLERIDLDTPAGPAMSGAG